MAENTIEVIENSKLRRLERKKRLTRIFNCDYKAQSAKQSRNGRRNTFFTRIHILPRTVFMNHHSAANTLLLVARVVDVHIGVVPTDIVTFDQDVNTATADILLLRVVPEHQKAKIIEAMQRL